MLSPKTCEYLYVPVSDRWHPPPQGGKDLFVFQIDDVYIGYNDFRESVAFFKL